MIWGYHYSWKHPCSQLLMNVECLLVLKSRHLWCHGVMMMYLHGMKKTCVNFGALVSATSVYVMPTKHRFVCSMKSMQQCMHICFEAGSRVAILNLPECPKANKALQTVVLKSGLSIPIGEGVCCVTNRAICAWLYKCQGDTVDGWNPAITSWGW